MLENKLTGVLNFRDLGGMETETGHVIRHGAVYRSGELNGLTDSDREVLAALAIRSVFDLRTPAERAAAPANWNGAGPETIALSPGFGPGEDPASVIGAFFADGINAATATAAMQAVTVKIALDGAVEIGQLLRRVGTGDTPTIIHCTAGKDRTGVVSALLLLLLGVPKEAIYLDYLRSNAAVPHQIARFRSAAKARATGLPPGIAGMPPDAIRVLLGVDSRYLDAAFAAIDVQYGSFRAYVAEGLGLTSEDTRILRERLLHRAVE